MISLFNKAKVSPLNVVTLPSYCVPTTESNDLDAKRDAKLQWMRDNGMTYLGDPLKQIEKRPQRSGNVAPVRLVSVRKDIEAVAADVLAREA
jgi:hypothetical protein